MAKPRLVFRIGLIGLMFFVSFIPPKYNFIVKLELILGLTPSVIEKVLGIKCLFCGMTQAFHYLAHFQIVSAIKCNFWSPVALILGIVVIMKWDLRLLNKKQEYIFFIVAIILTFLVNVQTRLFSI